MNVFLNNTQYLLSILGNSISDAIFFTTIYRAYYQLKGTHINSGGIHIHEIFRTNLKYLENMNKIPDEVLITKEEEQEQEEAKRPGGDDDFLIGFLNEYVCCIFFTEI